MIDESDRSTMDFLFVVDVGVSAIVLLMWLIVTGLRMDSPSASE